MVNVNLANLPSGHSHQEFERELPPDASGMTDAISLTGVFNVYNKYSRDYEFNGYIEYDLPLECDRCGTEFTGKFREYVRFIIKMNSDIEDIDIISANSNIVDLMSYFRDIIITGIPMKNLCDKCSEINDK